MLWPPRPWSAGPPACLVTGVRLEQALELPRRSLGGRDELGFIVLDRGLRLQRRLVVLTEHAHLRGRRFRVGAELDERLLRQLEAGAERLAPDTFDAGIHELERVLAIACAREERAGAGNGGARSCTARTDASTSSMASTSTSALPDAGGAPHLEARRVAVIELVAEAAQEVDLRLA